MRVHLIAIGGAVMHNLALALQHKGYIVSGSDDVIFSPAKERLAAASLLPNKMGWDEDNIQPNLDFIVLGMHAKADNIELLKAQSLGIPIYSFPAYIFQHAEDKKRLVIAGSHGKTTTTAMVMHALKFYHISFDYLVGSQIEGYDRMVSLTTAPIMVIEGDEYLSSALDLRPKFLHYKAHASVVTGIEWDHINVFPSFEKYVNQFNNYTSSLETDAALFVHSSVANTPGFDAAIPFHIYDAFDFIETEETCSIVYDGVHYPLQVFGAFNIQNITAAAHLCETVGISIPEFLNAIKTFKGSGKRQEVVFSSQRSLVLKDFAHSPSKVKAAISAMRNKFKNRKLISLFELHTYSSLQENFIPFYTDSLNPADFSVVYIDDESLKIKGKERPSLALLHEVFPHSTLCFSKEELSIFCSTQLSIKDPNETQVWLWMSSGHFGGFDFEGLPYN